LQTLVLLVAFGLSIHWSRASSSNRLGTVLFLGAMLVSLEYVAVFVENHLDPLTSGVAFFKVAVNLSIALMLHPLERASRSIINRFKNN